MRSLIIVAGLLVAGFLTYRYAPIPSLSKGPEQVEMPTLRARKDTLTESAVAIGIVKAKVGAEVKVGSQLSGVVSDLRVNVGDKVAKGDILARLQDADWRARADVLEAELASAIAEMEFADTELQRMERLADVVPQTQIDTARMNVKVKRADVDQVRASLREAQIRLSYTIIRAPVSGTIASVSTYKGETIAASFSAPTFLTIVDLDRLEVQSYVDETDIGKVRVGQPVTIRIDAYPGRELEGVVQAIYPKAQLINNVVNYVVIVDILNNPDLLIRPEMTAHVNFILEQRKDVVSIPRSALLREGGRNYVIVQAGDQWNKRQVEIGLQTPQSIEIVSGLKEGETILADKQAWKDHLEKSS